MDSFWFPRLGLHGFFENDQVNRFAMSGLMVLNWWVGNNELQVEVCMSR